MSEYMIALKGGFDTWDKKSENEKMEQMSHFSRWADGLIEKGHYKTCLRPEPSGENRRISLSEGKVIVDGPFPETKEIISGAFVVSAKNISEATELAKECPVLKFGGSVEIFKLTEGRDL